MNIHEYQAKALLREYGAPLLPGEIASSADAAMAAARKLGGHAWVVKAQIHAGGRGKGGGVKIARTIDEVGTLTARMIGKPLVTAQTGAEGRIVHQVYIEQTTDIERELYLSLLIDSGTARITFLVSPDGGMDIEKQGHGRIRSFSIDPAIGYSPHIGRKIIAVLGLKNYAAHQGMALVERLYDAFIAKDMSLLEINPLVQSKDGELFLLDAKISFDDNALFRHPEVQALRDPAEEEPTETEAAAAGLSYIKLAGNIGCMVNGAGLAMATMDIIKHYGGEPANFLDVGGGATREQVTKAFRLILADHQVKGILVNIFGGIMKCDIIAEGVIAAAREIQLQVPVVVRLAGTNVDKGKATLAASGLSLIAADDLADAARKIVAAVGPAAHG
ncbi:MAG: ADP-forming succinate--CoA ligase subunit beta [Rhizomicrobium sp.]